MYDPREQAHSKLISFLVQNGQVGHGSVRLRLAHGTVRAVPVFGSDSSSGERVS